MDDNQYVVPAWARVLFGLGIIALILWKAPVYEIAVLFFYIVLIPLVFLTAIGAVGSGTIDMLGGRLDRFRERVETHRRNIERDYLRPEPKPEPVPQS